MSEKKQRPSKGGVLPKNPSERDLAAFTGMSRRQIWQAKKIAEIPEEEFDRLVESENPPTVTQLLQVAHQRAGSKPKAKKFQDHDLIERIAVAICEADCGLVTDRELERCRRLAVVAIDVITNSLSRGANVVSEA